MYTEKDYELTLSRLFDRADYKVWLDPIDLQLKHDDLPEDFEPVVQNQRMEGYDDLCGIQIHKPNPMHDVLIDACYNRPRFTRDMDEKEDIYRGQNIQAVLTPVDITNILTKGGSLTMLDPHELVRLDDVLSTYITQVDYRARWEPHYHEPPAEDIQAFKSVLRMIEPVVSRFKRRAYGNTEFMKLLRTVRQTATGNKEVPSEVTDTPGIVLDGKSKDMGIDWSFKPGKYDL